jgi:hypothetical protein
MVAFRQSRFFSALIAIFSMFFMQFAIAGYVCPELKPFSPETVPSASVEAVDNSIPNCHESDLEQPNLCNAHAQVGDQSLDKHELPSVKPFVAGFLANVVLAFDSASSSTAAASTSMKLLERSTAPPASIRNCCFRI